MGKRLKVSSNRRSAAPSRIPWDDLYTKHDESGQVYTEVSCRAGPMIADWKWRTIGSALQYRTFRSPGPGCSSLYDMSMRSCLFSSIDITSETLEEIPERIGLALWNQIVTVYVRRTPWYLQIRPADSYFTSVNWIVFNCLLSSLSAIHLR